MADSGVLSRAVASVYRAMPFLNKKYDVVSGIKGGRLLNLGCGVGLLEGRVLSIDDTLEITAVDIDDYSAFLDAKVKFHQLDISGERLPFKDDFFDAEMMVQVIEHIKDPAPALKEAHRVLLPGGRFYVETPSPRSLRMPSMRSPFLRFWFGEEGNPLNFFDDPTHIEDYDGESLGRALEEAGFSVSERGFVRDWPSFLLSPFLILVGFVFRKRNVFT